MMKKLAVVTTHPIQYNAPLFRLIAERKKIDLRVFYTWSQSEGNDIYDPGFGIQKKWDIPLTEGYSFRFSENISATPGSHHHAGIDNPTLTAELLEYRPDAILVYGWNFKSHLRIIRNLGKKIPVFFRGDSTLLDLKLIPIYKRIAKKIILTNVYRHVSKALYTGLYNKAYFMNYGMDAEKLVFMPHAIDNERFGNARKEDVKQLRERLNIPPDHIVGLFAGKLEKKKNPLLLIRSFLQIYKPGQHLVMVGNGPLENELHQLCASEKNIHFLPFQNQSVMPAVYSMADFFILPSQGPEETWGLAVNEAMAAGKPVVVSDKCGCSIDLVKDNGYVFESGNQKHLSDVLQVMYKKGKNELLNMGNISKQIIAQWSFEHCAEVLETLINKE